MDLGQLGARIKERREKQGLRQSDLASALRVTAQAVSKWERGENAPDIQLLVGLSHLLGVSVEWLLGGRTAERDTFAATVFCTGLNGFARRAAAMPPRDVADWANGIYYTVTEALLRHEGVPVKYVGDGSLGFFAGEDQAERSLAAARQARRNLHSQDLVICLHHGEVYLGNIGHPDYASPDIMGQTVNTAFLAMAWVAEHCKSGIGLTGAVFDRLSDQRGLEQRGEVAVLGPDEPITIYEPEGEGSSAGNGETA